MFNPHRKYIAEGFVEDAGRLMNDFLETNSVEFPDFASVWRKHHFSLIFMGRPDNVETSEFVNEIFRLSSQYLLEEEFMYKVGGIYMLYALFRNQISQPPIKIRLELTHWTEVKSVRNQAILEKKKTLHYVIDYLIENGFLFVANQTLRGPMVSGVPTACDVFINRMKNIFQDGFNEYVNSNDLQDLRELQNEYMEVKKKYTSETTTENIYEEVFAEMKDIDDTQKLIERNACVGSSRAMQLKADAFQHVAKSRYETSSNASHIGAAGSSKDGAISKVVCNFKEGKKKDKPRQEDRRPGRPSKKQKDPLPPPETKSDDEEFDISHLLEQQKELYLPPVNSVPKKSKTRRDPYYQRSPKREEHFSDSDHAEATDHD